MSPAAPTPAARSPLARLAAGAVHHRRRVLLAWLAFLVLAVAAMSAFGGAYGVDYATPGSDSARAAQTLAAQFGGRSPDSVDVVYTTSRGTVTDPAVTRSIDATLAQAGRLEGLQRGATSAQASVSRDRRTAVVRVPLTRVADEVPGTTGKGLLALAQRATAGGLSVSVGGADVGQRTEAGSSSESIGLAVAVLVLLATFGGAVAAGLPLVTALFGIGIAVLLGGLVAAAVPTPDWAPQVAIMIGLGVGIDYALLVLTRHKAALARGASTLEATVEAMSTAGRSVLVAGATVVISLLGLLLMRLPYLNGVAYSASLAVLVVMAATLTLLPALLGFAGHRVDRLRLPGLRRPAPDPDRSRAAAWARRVQRRPLVASVAAIAVLLVMAAPLAGIRFGFPDAGNDAAGSTTRVAYDTLARGFGPGANGPLVAVAAVPDAAARARLERLRRSVSRDAGVRAVAAVQLSSDRRTALLAVTPRSAPQAEQTKQLVDRLRDGPLAAARLDVRLGGQTAATVDQAKATAARLPLFIGGVIGVSFLLLLLAFRAPVLALKAGLMNLLSIGAAYGVVALVAQGGWAGQLVGIDTSLPIPPFIPVMMFAVLFGLSMDYEVFLMSRVREEITAGRDARTAVVAAVARTARVITAAAAIMVAVFGAFALSPEVFLKLIGIGLATAILVDATVVRMVLVPAVMQLLGERAWWTPRWLERPMPQVDLEGAPEPSVA